MDKAACAADSESPFMYENHFNQLSDQLSSASTASLIELAASGGWRKYVMDNGRAEPESWLDFKQMFMQLLSLVISIFPPTGSSYRRAMVAQNILDQKGVVW